MTLDASKPTDQALNAELPSYIREDRVAINAIPGPGDVDFAGFTDLIIATGAVSLAVGTDLGTYSFETIRVTGAGLANISIITGGTEGQVKIFIFQDANIAIVDGNTRINGVFYLNHLPAGTNFSAQQDDVLAVINIGGNGAATYGYWKELYRTVSVK